MKILVALLLLLIFLPVNVLARRITPEDIISSQRETYNQKVQGYSLTNQQNLEQLSQQIVLINDKRTDDLEKLLGIQAAVLDEYETRYKSGGKYNKELVEKARYWITFAHEAVAYQAAKIYIFNLTTEGNIKADSLNTISQFETQLNSARSKVINSQKYIQDLFERL